LGPNAGGKPNAVASGDRQHRIVDDRQRLNFVGGIGIGVVVVPHAVRHQCVGHTQKFLNGSQGVVGSQPGQVNRYFQKAFAAQPVNGGEVSGYRGSLSNVRRKSAELIRLYRMFFGIQKGTVGGVFQNGKTNSNRRRTYGGARLVQTGDRLTVLVNGNTLKSNGLRDGLPAQVQR
jgi:hypothetical protein